MSNSFQKEIPYLNNLEEQKQIIEKTLAELGWRFTTDSEKIYKATINANFKSSGENLSILISDTNKTLIIKSKLKFGLVDWGVNKKNVELFEMKLSEILDKANIHEGPTNEEQQNEFHNIFINDLIKIKKLLVADILSKKEFLDKKSSKINELNENPIGCSKEDFLLSLIDLKDKNILDDDDITKIKQFI